jgi:hypothetical protein
MDIFSKMVNISYSIGIVDLNNGIAFRKENLNNFDREEKINLKNIIEEVAAKDTNFNDYQLIDKKITDSSIINKENNKEINKDKNQE